MRKRILIFTDGKKALVNGDGFYFPKHEVAEEYEVQMKDEEFNELMKDPDKVKMDKIKKKEKLNKYKRSKFEQMMSKMIKEKKVKQ